MTVTKTPVDTESDGFTIADLDAMPDDGRRYELIGGAIVVTPAPGTHHQRGSRKLQRMLEDSCPPRHEVFDAPVNFDLPGGHRVEPDLVVAPFASVADIAITPPVFLVVEFISPGSRRHDLVTKRGLYAEAGIEHYWVLDRRDRSFTAFVLPNGGTDYDVAVEGTDHVRVAAPIALDLDVPSLFRQE